MLTLQSLWTAIATRPAGANSTAPNGWLRLPALWHRRLRHRHALSLLDPQQLRDAGLNPDMIRREAAKPFWLE